MNANHFLPPLLLIGSNCMMTYAWYGHLKHPGWPLWLAIVLSWGIALAEYCLAVPANRFGHAIYDAAELKTMQEVITLIVFSIFSVVYLREDFPWNYVIAFGFIVGAVFFMFKR